MRISGITIPDDKQLSYALTAVYGIGLKRSQMILDELSIALTSSSSNLKFRKIMYFELIF